MVPVIGAVTHLDAPQGVGAIRLDRFSPNFVSAVELGLCNVRPDRSYDQIYGLSPDELTDIAYYFEHDYVDGRTPRSYLTGVEAATDQWYIDAAGPGLVYVEHDDRLAVWDFRAAATRRLTILAGPERELYLFCDRHRSRTAVLTHAAEHGLSPAAAADTLDRWTAGRLMVSIDDRYLSVAVRSTAAVVPTPRPTPAAAALVF